MAKKELTAKDIEHISVRELAFKIKSVDDYIGNAEGEEARNNRKPSLAFFLGAGASFESGIMLAGQMMKKFREKIFQIDCHELKKDDEKAEWLAKQKWFKSGNDEYGCLFEKAHSTKAERQRFIENMIADKEPSFGYVILADLLLRNYINTVLTTNFDDLVYISATNFTGNRPIVYAYGILASEMKMTSPHSKVLKLHGDYLYSNIVNTSAEMLKQSQALKEPYLDEREAISSLNMERQVRTVFDNFGLVVIGYSGGDKTVMELLENVSKDNGFYWCYRKGNPPATDVLELIKRKEGKLVEIEGFDALMKEISDITDFSIDDLLDSLDQRKEKLKNSIAKFDPKYNKESLEKYGEELKETQNENPDEKLTAADYFILGNIIIDTENSASAEEYYLKAIELNPNFADAYNNLGTLLAEDESRWTDAEEKYNKAIELNPNYAEAYNNLGILLAKDESRWAEAEAKYNKAIALNLNYANAYNSLGMLHYNQRKFDKAIGAFENAASLDENHVSSRVGLAGAYKHLNKLIESKKYLDKAFAVVKDDDYYNLACLYSISENKDKTFDNLKLAIKKNINYKIMAKTDADFDFIRDDARFVEIVGGDEKGE